MYSRLYIYLSMRFSMFYQFTGCLLFRCLANTTRYLPGTKKKIDNNLACGGLC